ncbi:hypothetical protein PsorP6_014672 [Peronosclerospora sorghi]|uniref:Uncharacterized protein n=1 Tax=Peronosclerospora sorghi TaxID=230839 RepID=A0ACC0VSH6_9STRA|nr:hypothetical protein PsorP6_014672 [Peronosclerospora sorghi]
MGFMQFFRNPHVPTCNPALTQDGDGVCVARHEAFMFTKGSREPPNFVEILAICVYFVVENGVESIRRQHIVQARLEWHNLQLLGGAMLITMFVASGSQFTLNSA